jgi:dihydroneopterin aldolase
MLAQAAACRACFHGIYHRCVADMVSIIDLNIDAIIGIYDWERKAEQTLVFNIDMASDVAKAAASDAIADALDYSKIAAAVKIVVTMGKFQLIETAAERVAEKLLADYALSWLRVEVAKPLPGEGYTAVITIERPLVRGLAARKDRRKTAGIALRYPPLPGLPTALAVAVDH